MKKVLLLILLCAFYSGSIGQITMSTANCTVTANEIQMDITVTNTSPADLRWNGTVIRFTVPAAIIPAGTHTFTTAYIGGSDFPLSFPDGPGAPGAGAFYLASSGLLSWGSTPSTAYNNVSPACGAPLILAGQTKTIGRFSFKITSANFVTGQPATFTWHTTSSCNLYQACAPIVTGYATAALRTLAPPCITNTPYDCSGVSISGAVSNAICAGSSTGSITALTSGTTAPVSYTISPAINTTGATTGVFTGLPAGSYIISLTDGHACSVSSGTLIVGQPPMVTGIENHTAVNCFGGTSTVTIGATSGIAPFTYSLNSGPSQSSNIFSGVPQGNHIVTITDANGCTGNVSVNISQPSQLIPSETHTAIVCAGGNSSVTISATGGNPPYSGTGTFSQPAGTVNYNISDASGCSVIYPVTVTGPSPLSLPVVNVTQPTCTSLGQITVSSPAPGPGIFYSIDGVNYTNSTGIFTIPSVGGTFNVSYKNGTCFSPSVSAVVNSQPPTPATPGITSVNNLNGTYTLTATGVSGPVLWSTGQTTLSIIVIPSITPYTVIQSNGTCNSAPASISVANILTDPAVGGMLITNMSNIQQNTNALLFTQTYKLKLPVYNLNQVHAIPNGTTTVTINLGKRLKLDPSYVLSTAPLSSYFTWSLSTISGNEVITGTQIQTIPPDYEDVASFNVLGFLSCTSNVHSNITSTITDEDLNNNNSDLSYTFGVTVSGLPTNVSCNAANNGSIVVTSSPGTTVQVTNEFNVIVGTTSVTTNLPPGLYVVTATAIGDAPENEQCTASTNVIVSEPTVLTATATGTDILCNGASTGTVTANPSGGTLSYSYSWNSVPVQTTQTAIDLPAGTYTCTITDAMGCVTFATVTITEPATPMTVIVTGQNVTCNGFYNGSATVSVSGGTPGYTYSWNTAPVQTTATATGLMAGIYTCTITDANGCIETGVYEVTEADVLTGAITGTDINCAGYSTGTLTVHAVTGGTAPYSYMIAAGPTANTTGATTGIFTGLIAGTYYVSVTDANNCSILLIYTISEPAALLLSATVTPVSCFNGNNGTINASTIGGSPAYSYTISPAVNITGATSGNFTGLPAGTYNVTVTDISGCFTSQSVIITEPATAVSATTTGTAVLCFGGNNASATATPSGGTAPYTYSWNTVPLQTTASVSSLAAGSYTVTVTDANGCTATSTYVVTQPASPVSSVASGSNVSCHGGNNGTASALTTGGTGSYTYTISGPTINTTGASTGIFTGLTSGIYTITSTDANGCSGSAVHTITQPAASLTMSAATTTGNACNLGTNGTITVSAANGSPGYTYSITSGPTINTSGASTGAFTGLAGGAYTILCTDANGCTVSVNATVYAPAGIVTDISLGSDYTSNFYVLPGVENTIMFNVTEIGGNPAVGDTIRITNVAGYILSYDQTSTSIPLGFFTYTLNNAAWKIDNSNPAFVSLIKMHPTNPLLPGTVNCGSLERITLKMKRNTPNISTFTLSARLRRANGEVSLANNLSSIIFTAE